MKIKLLLTGVVAAAIVASSAVGSPSADKGKPNATGPGCKPRIAVIRTRLQAEDCSDPQGHAYRCG